MNSLINKNGLSKIWEKIGVYFGTKISSDSVTKKVNVVNEDLYPGAIVSTFSVSATKKVMFANGNLQYQPSTQKWRFANNQYDVVGGVNDLYSTDKIGTVYETIDGEVVKCNNVTNTEENMHDETYAGWIDLFSKGCDGWQSGAVYYKPTQSTLGPNTALDYYQYPTENTPADFGRYCTIQGTSGSDWRLLNATEWTYLYCSRKVGNKYLWAKSMLYFDEPTDDGVDHVTMVILFPDDFKEMPVGCENIELVSSIVANPETSTALFTSDTDFDDNIITEKQYGLLEAIGCVFLPCAGVTGIKDDSVFEDKLWYKNFSIGKEYCSYHSSSGNSSTKQNTINWATVNHNDGSSAANLQFQQYKANIGMPVRLVRGVGENALIRRSELESEVAAQIEDVKEDISETLLSSDDDIEEICSDDDLPQTLTF